MSLKFKSVTWCDKCLGFGYLNALDEKSQITLGTTYSSKQKIVYLEICSACNGTGRVVLVSGEEQMTEPKLVSTDPKVLLIKAIQKLWDESDEKEARASIEHVRNINDKDGLCKSIALQSCASAASVRNVLGKVIELVHKHWPKNDEGK